METKRKEILILPRRGKQASKNLFENSTVLINSKKMSYLNNKLQNINLINLSCICDANFNEILRTFYYIYY